MGRKLNNMSPAERAAAMAERRRKKEEKARRARGGAPLDPQAAKEEKAEKARRKAEARLPPLEDRIPPSARVVGLASSSIFNAVHFAYIGAVLYALAAACDHAGPDEACSRLGHAAGYTLAIAALLHSALLLGSFVPAVEGPVVAWALLPVFGLAALPTQLLVLGSVLRLPGAMSPVAVADATGAGPQWFMGNWLALISPPLVLIILIWRRRVLYSLYFYDAAAKLSPNSRRINVLYQTSAPLLLFVAWYAVFRRDGWLATDIYAWPGLGTLLLCTASTVFPLWAFLRFHVSSLFGPIMWHVYGRRGLAWCLNERTNELFPLVLLRKGISKPTPPADAQGEQADAGTSSAEPAAEPAADAADGASS